LPPAGATEQDLEAHGRRYVATARAYRDTAYGWALEDTASFAKILADPDTRLLLGAYIIGPQASILIQPLIQAMCLGNTVDEIASGVLYIHPALTEVIQQALLDL
jgi:mycothione reductase